VIEPDLEIPQQLTVILPVALTWFTLIIASTEPIVKLMEKKPRLILKSMPPQILAAKLELLSQTSVPP